MPSRVKEQAELRTIFSRLRIDFQAFQQRLKIGIEIDEAKKNYDKLLDRYAESASRFGSDLAYTKRLKNGVQNDVGKLFKERGYTSDE